MKPIVGWSPAVTTAHVNLAFKHGVAVVEHRVYWMRRVPIPFAVQRHSGADPVPFFGNRFPAVAFPTERYRSIDRHTVNVGFCNPALDSHRVMPRGCGPPFNLVAQVGGAAAETKSLFRVATSRRGGVQSVIPEHFFQVLVKCEFISNRRDSVVLSTKILCKIFESVSSFLTQLPIIFSIELRAKVI
jgi:hypothetical protein